MKDAPIVIFDEATANVDPENEDQLQKAMEALTREKTVLMIAHRLKTVRNADQILVLDLIGRLAHEEGICAVMNTHYPTNALSISDDAFMLNREGSYIYGNTEEVLTEQNISRSFDVNVVVNQARFGDRIVKSIIPVSITGQSA